MCCSKIQGRICYGTTQKATQKATNSEDGVGRKRQVQMPLFSFVSIYTATDSFSAANKLGEGSFGPVYKECFNVPKHNALEMEYK
jgi:hypothetical protein